MVTSSLNCTLQQAPARPQLFCFHQKPKSCFTASPSSVGSTVVTDAPTPRLRRRHFNGDALARSRNASPSLMQPPRTLGWMVAMGWMHHVFDMMGRSPAWTPVPIQHSSGSKSSVSLLCCRMSWEDSSPNLALPALDQRECLRQANDS